MANHFFLRLQLVLLENQNKIKLIWRAPENQKLPFLSAGNTITTVQFVKKLLGRVKPLLMKNKSTKTKNVYGNKGFKWYIIGFMHCSLIDYLWLDAQGTTIYTAFVVVVNLINLKAS